VLANIIQNRPWEGRFSAENRKWAQTIPLPEGENWDRLTACNVHPGLLDVLTTEVRREIRAQEREHNPDQATSLADRLEAARDSVQKMNPVKPQNPQRSKNDLAI
jgi:DnaJ-domain-containing protein 1